MGLVTPSDVEGWAYGQIEQLEHPPITAIELTTCANKSPLDVASELAKVEGSGDLAKGGRLALALLHERIRTGSVVIEAACQMLYEFSLIAQVPDQERLATNRFDDSLSLAKQGIFSMADVTKEVTDFLATYASLESEIPLPWNDQRVYF